MPTLIPYDRTLAEMQAKGFRSLYYNSGAFGFADPAGVEYVGWLAADDSTIRPEMRGQAHVIGDPAALRAALLDAWKGPLGATPVWVMPLSHWAYELDFGSHDWMPAALREVGVDPEPMRAMHTGNAIEFLAAESDLLVGFVSRLLVSLKMSDFMLAFPGAPVPALCTVHHHHQLWWAAKDAALVNRLHALAGPTLSD